MNHYHTLPGTFAPVKPHEYYDGELYMRDKQTEVVIDVVTGQQVVVMTDKNIDHTTIQ